MCNGHVDTMLRNMFSLSTPVYFDVSDIKTLYFGTTQYDVYNLPELICFVQVI